MKQLDPNAPAYSMSFETQYQLDCFREIQAELFDSDGLKFSLPKISTDNAESMLKLINQMELEIKILINELNK